ncbi:MAG: lipid-A-disaccharide synthase [Clostridium sp.]|nr:lipid-A-disaccharide synthase [Clostridium sp.]
MKYFISAGEASGDLHASRLIGELKQADPSARFVFLGGDMMVAAAGSDPLIDYRDMAYMGFVDVVRHLPKVLSNLRRAREALRRSRPDALIIVDYPSFNLRLAAEAARLGIPVFAYISPKVWAWKEGRIPKMRRLIRRLYSILPFEPAYFARKQMTQVMYVGNPSVEETDDILARSTLTPGQFREANGLDGRPLLALVPGSRRSEIRANLPVMTEVAARHPEFQPVIAAAPGIELSIYDCFAPISRVVGQTFDLIRFADAALVTSGTAVLECALLRTPQVACYRANGSRVAYELFKRILKIPYVTLPNLIAGREIVPEMLVYLCTADRVDRELTPLLDPRSPERTAMLAGYDEMRQRLGTSRAAPTAARDIVRSLGK